MRNFKVLFLLLVCGLASSFPAVAAGDVVILCYHTFLGTHTSSMDFSPEEMGIDLDKIASLGYKFVTLDDAIAGKIEGKANIVITIDDGNHSIVEAYQTVFKPRGIQPELFIYPAIIGHDKFALTWEQLKNLTASGCGLGAHGYHHEYLSPTAFKKDERKFLDEIEKPAASFSAHIGSVPRLFAYPFAIGSPQAEAALAKEGYTWAFLGDDKVVPVHFDDASLDRYAVPRTIVYRWSFPLVLKALKANIDAKQ